MEFFLFALLAVFSSVHISSAVELTFELPDNEKQCFYEDIKAGEKTSVEFQVVTGGNYDVDCQIKGPDDRILYNKVKEQYGDHSFTTEKAGTYSVCFSNEFSTFSHKIIYLDWQTGEEKPLPGLEEHHQALTQMETSAQAVHENLNAVDDYQTHYKLRETQGRKRAEELGERVLYWSVGETIAILLVTIGQVFVLRNFFAEKKPSEMGYRQLH
ncbi:Transmembrane emp24 domain-containing protein 7 [Amphibalanus amphitrite]|uniref:Transmembrane emp24 domain-containing protein 7 n=1 Tax=Amphibalanus amphitrite TaxID=1232801 RepID=A0A6A4VSB3_AMPAM|nr:transmembrane emp24 domain-containing protein 7-like isoform X4 [Amphibalanus amphitrite]XP_043194271.1 transmembrane emp24 domain-containing protein 7-like isoform X4 [Amphibalanus amphitrite]XP_043194272.1 transmembrane emp24 domain-containing protein 7-like isoform X4 [Amphibalanus amphitrite]XP_043194274.1 transmembrane emp24 domain-containing protein 7-like isoform X4 [Amphibalanus amphitrite]XP_043194275.1 transmembrane emp24 domain-containing protein 7-like isoform X4 [Amphibalanus am